MISLDELKSTYAALICNNLTSELIIEYLDTDKHWNRYQEFKLDSQEYVQYRYCVDDGFYLECSDEYGTPSIVLPRESMQVYDAALYQSGDILQSSNSGKEADYANVLLEAIIILAAHDGETIESEANKIKKFGMNSWKGLVMQGEI